MYRPDSVEFDLIGQTPFGEWQFITRMPSFTEKDDKKLRDLSNRVNAICRNCRDHAQCQPEQRVAIIINQTAKSLVLSGKLIRNGECRVGDAGAELPEITTHPIQTNLVPLPQQQRMF